MTRILRENRISYRDAVVKSDFTAKTGLVIEMKAVVKSDFTAILKSATGKLVPAPVYISVS